MSRAETPWGQRHTSVAHFEPLFEYAHLPQPLRDVSAAFADLAEGLLDLLNDGPELSASLRKLLEAKDCGVRQAVLDRKTEVRGEGVNGD
jgi:hypothetical protein